MTELYLSAGKQSFRDLLLALATKDGSRTYGTFWGTGIDARMFSAAGLDVVAAEIVRAKHSALANDALMHGYRAHLGRAGSLRDQFDMFHADFDGGPSPSNFREVRRLAQITSRWLAVSVSLDHMRDESMQGEAAAHTIPAWLTGASGLTLEYLSRYRRNQYGQTMWTAILQRREGRGNSHRVQPVQIALSVRERGYWASKPMYASGLMTHRTAPLTLEERRRDHERYLGNRVPLAERSCRSCGVTFRPNHGRRWNCSDECRRTVYRKRYYAEHRDEVIASVREWREQRRSIVARPAEPSDVSEAA